MKLSAIVQTPAFSIVAAICAVRGALKRKEKSINLRLGRVKTWLAAIALASLSTGSFATIVSSGSYNPLNFAWSYNTGLSLLTGSGSMAVAGFNSSALTITVSLTNTSSLASDTLAAFGFGIAPDATGVSFVDANDGGFVDAGSAPGGINLGNGIIVDICVWGGSNCYGSSGIFGGGGSDTFSVVLSGIWGSSVSIDPLAFKYQTGYGPQVFTSDMSEPPDTGNVPEPGSGALVLLGLGLLGAEIARQQKRLAA